MDQAIVLSLKNRYSHLHPLVLSRSIERAIDESELFDILDTYPHTSPVSWDSNKRRWVKTKLVRVPTLFHDKG